MSFSSLMQGFLKTIIGTTREEIWIETANELGGVYESGGMWQSDKIIMEYRKRRVVLDMSAVTKGKHGALYSRYTMLFKNLNSFWFSIQDSSYSSTKKIDIPELDNPFYFSGSSTEQIKKLLEGSPIPPILLELKKVDFGIKNQEGFFGPVFPNETVQLQFVSEDATTDKEKIKKIFHLFSVTIDRLIELETLANIDQEPA